MSRWSKLEIDRQNGRRTVRQADRQDGRESDRRRDIQKDIQIFRKTERKADYTFNYILFLFFKQNPLKFPQTLQVIFSYSFYRIFASKA